MFHETSQNVSRNVSKCFKKRLKTISRKSYISNLSVLFYNDFRPDFLKCLCNSGVFMFTDKWLQQLLNQGEFDKLFPCCIEIILMIFVLSANSSLRFAMPQYNITIYHLFSICYFQNDITFYCCPGKHNFSFYLY